MLRYLKYCWNHFQAYRYARKCKKMAPALVAIVTPNKEQVRGVSDKALGCKISPSTGGVTIRKVPAREEFIVHNK